MRDDETLDLAYLTETVWVIGQRIRQNMALTVDIDALLAIEFCARTPALQRLASSVVDQAMMKGWGEYINNAQIADLSCQSTF